MVCMDDMFRCVTCTLYMNKNKNKYKNKNKTKNKNRNGNRNRKIQSYALWYDFMTFCVDGNRMTTSEVVRHLLINISLCLTKDECSMSTTSHQHLTVSGRDTMSTRISGHS